jgi:hypothetical protein
MGGAAPLPTKHIGIKFQQHQFERDNAHSLIDQRYQCPLPNAPSTCCISYISDAPKIWAKSRKRGKNAKIILIKGSRKRKNFTPFCHYTTLPLPHVSQISWFAPSWRIPPRVACPLGISPRPRHVYS